MRAQILGVHTQPIASPFHDLFFAPAFRGVAIMATLLIVVMGPVAYGAQLSGPGDFLYALETDVVEPVEEALQFTSEAKQEYHTERLAERLSELRSVDLRSVVLTPEESSEMIEDVTEHAEEASRETEPVAERILPHLIRTAALLSAHEELLDDVGVDETRVVELADTLDARINIRTQEYLETVADPEIAADVAEKLDRADDVLPTIQSRNESEELTRRFSDVQEAVEAGAVDEAFIEATELEIDLLAEQYLQGQVEE